MLYQLTQDSHSSTPAPLFITFREKKENHKEKLMKQLLDLNMGKNNKHILLH